MNVKNVKNGLVKNYRGITIISVDANFSGDLDELLNKMIQDEIPFQEKRIESWTTSGGSSLVVLKNAGFEHLLASGLIDGDGFIIGNKEMVRKSLETVDRYSDIVERRPVSSPTVKGWTA